MTIQRMTISAPSGTREVDVPRFLRQQVSLTNEQVIEVVQLALTLEATMGYPVDIECAYKEGSGALQLKLKSSLQHQPLAHTLLNSQGAQQTCLLCFNAFPRQLLEVHTRHFDALRVSKRSSNGPLIRF